MLDLINCFAYLVSKRRQLILIRLMSLGGIALR